MTTRDEILKFIIKNGVHFDQPKTCHICKENGEKLSAMITELVNSAPTPYTDIRGGYNTGWNNMCQNVAGWKLKVLNTEAENGKS